MKTEDPGLRTGIASVRPCSVRAILYDVQFAGDLGLKVHNLDTDDLKIALTNTAPVVGTNAVRADITEIATGGGYTQDAAGNSINGVYSEAGGVGTMTGTDVVFTATTGFGPFRYAVLYNTTPISPVDPLVGYWDYGSAVTLLAAETFTVDFGASVFTVT
mgnify:CR=1 FL=1